MLAVLLVCCVWNEEEEWTGAVRGDTLPVEDGGFLPGTPDALGVAVACVCTGGGLSLLVRLGVVAESKDLDGEVRPKRDDIFAVREDEPLLRVCGVVWGVFAVVFADVGDREAGSSCVSGGEMEYPEPVNGGGVTLLNSLSPVSIDVPINAPFSVTGGWNRPSNRSRRLTLPLLVRGVGVLPLAAGVDRGADCDPDLISNAMHLTQGWLFCSPQPSQPLSGGGRARDWMWMRTAGARWRECNGKAADSRGLFVQQEGGGRGGCVGGCGAMNGAAGAPRMR